MQQPAQLSTIFDFGQYDGRTVEDVIDDNPHYLHWCMENVKDFDLAAGAKRYLREVEDCKDVQDYLNGEVD